MVICLNLYNLQTIRVVRWREATKNLLNNLLFFINIGRRNRARAESIELTANLLCRLDGSRFHKISSSPALSTHTLQKHVTLYLV